MNLQDYDFEKIKTPFDQPKTDKFLLAIAIEKGFDKHHNPYNELFSKFFFSGGSMNFKESASIAFRVKAVPYLKTLMQSFEPKHEDKAAVCALILSELCKLEGE